MLLLDSLGGIAYLANEYLDEWDDEMQALYMHHGTLWARRKWRPTVAVVLLNREGHVLVLDDQTLPEYPLAEQEGFLLRSYRGVKEQFDLDPCDVTPFCPVLIAPTNATKISNVGDQPDELGFFGKDYCAVALRILRSHERGLHGVQWYSPEQAIERLLVFDRSRSIAKERFTNVYRPAIRATIDLIQQFSSMSLPESRAV